MLCYYDMLCYSIKCYVMLCYYIICYDIICIFVTIYSTNSISLHFSFLYIFYSFFLSIFAHNFTFFFLILKNAPIHQSTFVVCQYILMNEWKYTFNALCISPCTEKNGLSLKNTMEFSGGFVCLYIWCLYFTLLSLTCVLWGLIPADKLTQRNTSPRQLHKVSLVKRFGKQIYHTSDWFG